MQARTRAAVWMDRIMGGAALFGVTAVWFAAKLECLLPALMLAGGWTALVFYADHYCKYMTDVEFLLELKGVPNRNLLCNTPFFIYSSDLEARTVEKVTSSVDIYSTVCSLFGLDVDLSCFVGSDALSDGEGYVYWRDYSWYDGRRYVDGSTIPDDEYGAEISSMVRRKLNLAWNAVIYDYFAPRE